MIAPLDILTAEVAALRAEWPDGELSGASDPGLLAINEHICRMKRSVEALQAKAASEISRRSRRELGPDALAKTQGFRTPEALIAAATGASTGEAARMVQVGEATAPRVTMTGDVGPARHPRAWSSRRSGAALAARAA